MKVNEIVIRLAGKYDLARLGKFNFRKVLYRRNRYFYKFDGIMHRYTFIPIDDNNIKITIRAKPSNKNGLVHQITFKNVNSFVYEYVDAIQIGGSRR